MGNQNFNARDEIEALKDTHTITLLHHPIRELEIVQRGRPQASARHRFKKLFSVLQQSGQPD